MRRVLSAILSTVLVCSCSGCGQTIDVDISLPSTSQVYSPVQWFDLTDIGTVQGAESMDMFIEIPYSLDVAVTDLYKCYKDARNMSTSEYEEYKQSILQVLSDLTWETRGCNSGPQDNSVPAELRHEFGDNGVIVYWSGHRDRDDGSIIGSEGQTASVEVPVNATYVRPFARLELTLESGGTVDSVDVAYYAQFFTSVLGYMVDDIFMMSLLKLGEKHMIDSEDGYYRRNITVVTKASDDGVGETYFSIKPIRNVETGDFGIELTADVYIDLD